MKNQSARSKFHGFFITIIVVLYCIESIVLYCIVFKHLYSAASGVNRSEALLVCTAPWEKQ